MCVRGSLISLPAPCPWGRQSGLQSAQLIMRRGQPLSGGSNLLVFTDRDICLHLAGVLRLQRLK